MLLKDRLIKIGNVLFKYRSYQFVIIVAILFLERGHFSAMKENEPFEVLCLFVILCGLLVRAFTVGFVHEKTSGRNTKKQNAYELNTSGAYSLVRNPLYVGNYLVLLGISLLTQDFQIVILNTVTFMVFYYPIIFTEEAYLLEKFGEQYAQYAREVNCFIPAFKSFRVPVRKFCLNSVLKREHDTWLTAAVSVICVEAVKNYYAGVPILEEGWIILISVTGVIWILLKYLKKRGRLLVPAQ